MDGAKLSILVLPDLLVKVYFVFLTHPLKAPFNHLRKTQSTISIHQKKRYNPPLTTIRRRRALPLNVKTEPIVSAEAGVVPVHIMAALKSGCDKTTAIIGGWLTLAEKKLHQ